MKSEKCKDATILLVFSGPNGTRKRVTGGGGHYSLRGKLFSVKS